ncbi:MAG TPA: dockerin type I domain-containing protein [Planctomycetota bacterium]|nr:dockerin type I domain-containing protein [Planctomycetota bacterium]
MIAQALIIASATLAAFQYQCDCPPIDIPSPAFNVRFDVDGCTGAIVRGTADVFNGEGFGLFQVVFNDNNIDPTQPQRTAVTYVTKPPNCLHIQPTPHGRMIYAPPIRVPLVLPTGEVIPEAIEMSRKIHIPNAATPQNPDIPGAKDFIRYYDRVKNLTSMPVTVDVAFVGRLAPVGSDAVPPIIRRGPGWVFIGDGPQYGRPFVGLVYYRGLDARADKVVHFEYPDREGLLSVVYKNVELPPNKPVAFLNFLVQTWEPMAATASESQRSLSTSDVTMQSMDNVVKDPDLSDLPPDDGKTLWNWFLDTDVNVDGYVNVLDLIIVRNDLGKTPESAGNPRSDVNADLRINVIDLILVRNDLGWPF